MQKRKATRQISVGDVKIGGGAPPSVQSMTNTDTRDWRGTLGQIRSLAKAGCQIVRVAIPDSEAARALAKIAARSPVPVIADIHFNSLLAIACVRNGASGIRINPGNIGGEDAVAGIAEECAKKNIPIRVGANSGSLPAKFAAGLHLAGEGRTEALADSLVESAIAQCRMIERHGFRDIKVSLKASDVRATVMACRKFSLKYDYPLHLGVTEAGGLLRGMVKSSVGIGALLLDGIGDTIRVSLTADPVEEVKAAIMILEAAGRRKACPELVSCPTCGRTEFALEKLLHKVEAEIEKLKGKGRKFKPAKIAIMGCAVNGPGEAKDADIGMSGAKDGGLVLFKKGKVIGSFAEAEAMRRFKKLMTELLVAGN